MVHATWFQTEICKKKQSAKQRKNCISDLCWLTNKWLKFFGTNCFNFSIFFVGPPNLRLITERCIGFEILVSLVQSSGRASFLCYILSYQTQNAYYWNILGYSKYVRSTIQTDNMKRKEVCYLEAKICLKYFKVGAVPLTTDSAWL